jgi:flagellar hook-basal body complex protein FliE
MAAPIGSINNAISAYNNAHRTGKVDEGMDARSVPQDEDFASLVQGAIKEAIKIGNRSEQMSIAAVRDRADLNEVVTAVAEAETTLQTVVTVRDKVLEAYKDIIRMPI